MKILLVSPSSEDDFLSRSMQEVSFLGAEAFFAPHSIATVAAMTPPGHEVSLHDEELHGSVIPRFDEGWGGERFDVVGISLKATQIGRALAIARGYRRSGATGALVVGGIGATYALDRLAGLFDTVFVGEAEETWPAYLEDLKRGRPRPIYQRASKPDMAKVPAPRWDLISDDIRRYMAAAVQTTRGCHFDCAFCDVIYTFGRTPRVKPSRQVLDEVRALERLGSRMVYFADDNFCTDLRATKALLCELKELNDGFEEPLGFITQVDITVARDEELLELLADCNFMELQIGIESNEPRALGDLNKQANAGVDLVDAVHRIQAHGLLVMAHLIIGAESDDATAFRRTLDFIDAAGVVHHFCHPLAAPPGTRLWYQLKREGRVVAPVEESIRSREMVNNIDVLTNIVPARMTRPELLEGVAQVWEQGHRLEEHHRRVLRFIEGVRRVPRVKRLGPAAMWRNRRMAGDLAARFLLGVSAEHRRVFLDLVAKAGRRDPMLAQRAMFAHANFMMERTRALASARLARAQAAWERAHPDQISTLPTTTPLPEQVRRLARQILEPAYLHVRQRIDGREALYRAVLEAMVDYTDRFGATFERVDALELDRITTSCDRALNRLEAGPPTAAGAAPLPADRMPRGFVREILDGLDRTLRVRGSS